MLRRIRGRGVFLAALAGACLLAACSTTSANTGEQHSIDVGAGDPVSVSGSPRIAVFLAGANNTLGQVTVDESKKVGAEQHIDVTVFDARYDSQVQYDQIQSAITSGRYNAFVVVAMDPNGVCDLVSKDAPAGGVVTVTEAVPLCGRAFGPPDQLYQPGTLSFVSGQSDSANFVRWAGEIRKRNPGPQKALFVTGPEILPSSVNSSKPFQAFAAQDPSFKVIVSHGDYTQQSGQDQTANLLTANPDATLIVTDYTDLTKGAVQALKDAGRTGVKVYDYGGGQDAVQLIKSGDVELTAAILPASWIRTSIGQIVNAFAGKPVDRIVPLGANEPFITRDNVSTFKPEY
ncbi:sugar ABC transporter substrate-binding protein [Amycolatopsis pithecellobii]|uniref:Substrate-binding domain-containing protein n=1 Tax=Amycolatopsis pithecellobii TaxID=664692 RepID=A0A6N7Z448_9PSEU|nr:sugar ABC transporter substrate-binding protein [Amycolatopsis pithecellobii]MTD56069.1 substrate-binding domain-containing protein [Amycolatopsis pithecellobii]